MSNATPLFPAGHPLHRLVRPTFDSIRRSLGGIFVATIWVDAAEDPSRGGFRPSYDSVHGPGSSTVMPFVASWLSSGPNAPRETSNIALFPTAMDPTVLAYAQRIGLLGEFELVENVRAMKERVRADASGRKLYNIDDLGPDFDDRAVVGAELSRWLNSKEHLAAVTGFGPREVVVDMFDATLAHYEDARDAGAGRVFLKTCNTESAGMGVFIANSAAEYTAQLAKIHAKQAEFGLSRRLVVQPEIRGENKSFQVLLDPRNRSEIAVVALSDQIVEADGKTYRSSVNHEITAERVEPVGAAILDMVDRIWASHPEAFGFLMSDYFHTDKGPVIYDPGIRPTGNTATAMASHLARKITGRFHATSLMPTPTDHPGLGFDEFAARAGRLVDPENLLATGRAVVPWGWNKLQGFGMLIGIAREEAELPELAAELARLAKGLG